MSSIARARHHLSHGLFGKYVCSAVVASCYLKSIGVSRHFAQTASSENEEEEVAVDQRRLPADSGPANFDPSEHQSPPTEKLLRLVDDIDGLTVAETAELSAILIRKLGVKKKPDDGAIKPGAAGVAGAATKMAAKEEREPEKTASKAEDETF